MNEKELLKELDKFNKVDELIFLNFKEKELLTEIYDFIVNLLMSSNEKNNCIGAKLLEIFEKHGYKGEEND